MLTLSVIATLAVCQLSNSIYPSPPKTYVIAEPGVRKSSGIENASSLSATYLSRPNRVMLRVEVSEFKSAKARLAHQDKFWSAFSNIPLSGKGAIHADGRTPTFLPIGESQRCSVGSDRSSSTHIQAGSSNYVVDVTLMPMSYRVSKGSVDEIRQWKQDCIMVEAFTRRILSNTLLQGFKKDLTLNKVAYIDLKKWAASHGFAVTHDSVRETVLLTKQKDWVKLPLATNQVGLKDGWRKLGGCTVQKDGSYLVPKVSFGIGGQFALRLIIIDICLL